MKREVVILTRSSKHGGFCVAGVDIRTGEWVRFVSHNTLDHGTLSKQDITYANSTMCKPLDIVQVDVLSPAPHPCQPENYLIDPRKYWIKTGECTLSDVLRIHPAEARPYIFGNQFSSIRPDEMESIDHSLTLVKVSGLVVLRRTNRDGKEKTRARFHYDGKYYNEISVTDPEFYSVPDETRYGTAYLVLSLPDAPYQYNNRYYKFVAKIFLP